MQTSCQHLVESLNLFNNNALQGTAKLNSQKNKNSIEYFSINKFHETFHEKKLSTIYKHGFRCSTQGQNTLNFTPVQINSLKNL